MAPIVLAVRSALLCAEPSHDTRASSAATPPSLLIGVPVFIIAIVLAIGTICWVLREKKAAKRLEEETPARTETTFSGAEIRYRRIPRLCESKAEQHDGSEPLRSSQCSASTLETNPASRSRFSKGNECGIPPQLFCYYQRSPSEIPYWSFPVERYPPPPSTGGIWQQGYHPLDHRSTPPVSELSPESTPSELYSPPLDTSTVDLFNPRSQRNRTPLAELDTTTTHISPFATEHRPNSVYYSYAIRLLSESNASVQDTGVQQVNDYISSDFDMAITEEEMLPGNTSEYVDAIHQQETAADSNETSVDIERDAASPRSNDFEQSVSYDDMPMQMDHPEIPRQYGSNAADVVIGDSQYPQAVDSTRTFHPAYSLNSAPRRRVAGRGLHPLEIHNTMASPSNDQNRIFNNPPRQIRRPSQRTLVPKSSPVQNLKNTSSPHSSKSTPDSAKTDLSFASTASQVILPGSSAITTPLLAVESPATPYTPSEDQVICRDCGKVFNTPGQQKKHYNRQHKLRYVCDICVRRFGVRADLERHEHTVHSDLFQSNKRFWCTVPGCKTPTQEWKRKDNFTRHARSCEARAARVAGAKGGSGKGKERALDIG